MNILVVTSSPHRAGHSTSGVLAEEFARGASEAGHAVEIFDAGHADIGPCRACYACKKTGECAFKDDAAVLNKKLLSADLIMFALPVYYFGLPAQLKLAVDRFYALDKAKLTGKRYGLLTTAGSDEAVMPAVMENFALIAGWFNWEKAGAVHAYNVNNVKQLNATDYAQQAYELGKSL